MFYQTQSAELLPQTSFAQTTPISLTKLDLHSGHHYLYPPFLLSIDVAMVTILFKVFVLESVMMSMLKLLHV